MSIIAIFIFADFLDTVNPSRSVLVRLAALSLSSAFFALLLFKPMRSYQDGVFAAITITATNTVLINLWMQPTLDNTWYLGLIQGYIMAGVLLRLSLVSMCSVVFITLCEFIVIAFSKSDSDAAVLQSANVGLVGCLIVFGVYLLQRYQRIDFINTLTIEKQNRQLSGFAR